LKSFPFFLEGSRELSGLAPPMISLRLAVAIPTTRPGAQRGRNVCAIRPARLIFHANGCLTSYFTLKVHLYLIVARDSCGSPISTRDDEVYNRFNRSRLHGALYWSRYESRWPHARCGDWPAWSATWLANCRAALPHTVLISFPRLAGKKSNARSWCAVVTKRPASNDPTIRDSFK
jgi:hypothetical protein